MLFEVSTAHSGEWVVLSVVGEIDLATMPAFHQAMERVDGRLVAVDLGAVDFLDPLVLGVLLTGSMRQKRRDGRLVVVCPPGPVRGVLEESGLARVVDVVGSRGELA